MIDNKLIFRQNPWWHNQDWHTKDLKIRDYRNSKFRYQPVQVLSLPEEKQAIHIISGPRQTGKSTAIKLKIKDLLERGVVPDSIFYYNCDSLSDKKEIIDLVASRESNTTQKQYFFLDEISSVSDWPYAIKWLSDEGFFRKTVVYLTGSSSINLKKSGELMPGRRGRGKNVNFLPLTFWEVLQLKGTILSKVTPGKDALNHLRRANLSETGIRKEFDSFISTTGGFLPIINDAANPLIHQIYLEVVKSEVVKAGKNEKNMRMVIKKLIQDLSAETSYTDIAEEAELGSKNTAIDYLEFLINSFFLHESLFFDIAQKRYILKKNKKYHFTDPYVLWLLWGYFTGSGVNIQKLEGRGIINLDLFAFVHDSGPIYENFIASELYKKQLEFYFYKNSREMDFYLPDKELGIEVKNKDNITKEDMKTLQKAKNKILVSKNTLEIRDDVLIIPVYLFSLLEF